MGTNCRIVKKWASNKKTPTSPDRLKSFGGWVKSQIPLPIGSMVLVYIYANIKGVY